MSEPDDHQLLGEFARGESENAFSALVARYINLVHSTAFRCTSNPHHAEEISQAVFIILARKAGTISPHVVLSGWLYQATRLTAANFIKGEIRRRQREQDVYMQSVLSGSNDSTWNEIVPLLDDAMGNLGQTDRDAIVLRFFQNKSAAEIGTALRMTEETARKRVNRALDKLRRYFSRYGVHSSTAIIANTISAQSVHAAPASLAKTVAAVAITKGVAASTSTLTLAKGGLKLMAWTKAKTAIVVGGIALLLAITTAVTGEILTKPTPFVKITGRGQIELYNNFFNKSRVVETADMTIWTDGKSYRISIVSRGTGTSTNNAYDMQAQYGSDGIDTFVLSDQRSPFHRIRGGFGGFADAGRFPTEASHHFIPLVVRAAWMAYCSSDYFNISSNQTGLKVDEIPGVVWPDYVTNLVSYWTNSTLPQEITGWSRNLILNIRQNSDAPQIAYEVKQYPNGFKAWKFTTDDPVIVGNRNLPRRISLETFFPKWGDTVTNGNNVIPLRKATFVVDSITVVKGPFDPLPPVTVPNLQLIDSRFEDIAGNYVIDSRATPQGWPTRGSKAFKQAQASAETIAAEEAASVQSELKKFKQRSQVEILH